MSTGSVPLFLLVFSPGILAQEALGTRNIAQGRPLGAALLF